MDEQDSYVYFIRSAETGLIKIGYTTQPEQRFRTLKSKTRETLSFDYLGPGSYQSEQRYHQVFAADRVHGEWFHPSQKLEQWIEMLNRWQVMVDVREEIEEFLDSEAARAEQADQGQVSERVA
jgi:hypothetical protein